MRSVDMSHVSPAYARVCVLASLNFLLQRHHKSIHSRQYFSAH